MRIPDAHGSKTYGKRAIGKVWSILVAYGSRGGRFSSSLVNHNVCRYSLVYRNSRVMDCGIDNGEGDMERVEEGAG